MDLTQPRVGDREADCTCMEGCSLADDIPKSRVALYQVVVFIDRLPWGKRTSTMGMMQELAGDGLLPSLGESIHSLRQQILSIGPRMDAIDGPWTHGQGQQIPTRHVQRHCYFNDRVVT
ncbi:hypothetical protein H310_04461 [Aphanomyces invadans]|uniref:Uncharacterized protein n=1 Tax=Aphanomyces invadans TaxID=157072 RepID=A0A024UDX3_9STRA|nr:hypothetical protein H310_04461 [Aphanomyces invadans]ETW04097.1 hypothetical protein H310_04461 [Aphanomyces invadans]|eukprot:XP_008867053.1 hypothetical protein H310_04461 [Aphanomyces invadans]